MFFHKKTAPLNQKRLADHLPKGMTLTFLEETHSTNDVAKELAKAGVEHGHVVIARTQSGGKGRMGRSFSSEVGGLYLSFIVRGKMATDPTFLTFSAAVAAANAIESQTKKKVGIKWVNDLWINKRKCAGILVEGIYDETLQKTTAAVVGIGINVYNLLPSELAHSATTLLKAGGFFGNITNLAISLCAHLWQAYTPSASLPYEEYKSRMVLYGKAVFISTPNETFRATVLDVAEDGGLLVKDSQGHLQKLTAGEVSLHNTPIE